MFANWSDNGAASHTYTVPLNSSTSTLTANFTATGACNTCAALSFDGSNDWVNIPDISLPADFTIEAWVKLPVTGTNHDIVVGQETQSMDINFYNNRFRLWNGLSDVAIAGVDNQAGVWTHYAVTRNNNQFTIYINGQQDNSATTNTWSGTFIPQAIGRSGTYFTNGQLDEVRIWNVARTAAQIQASFNQNLSNTTTGLVAYYKFNETTADQNVVDATGSNSGTLGSTSGTGTDDPVRVSTNLPPVNCEAARKASAAITAVQKTTEGPVSIVIYPNPTYNTSKVAIRAKQAGLYMISVTDLSGRILSRQQHFISSTNPTTFTVQLPAATEGIYFIDVKGNHQHTVEKILKLK